jgi:tetratricopeptide (TPR) repeat protein
MFLLVMVAALYAQDALQQADAAWLKRSASDQYAYDAIKLYEQAGQAAPTNDVPWYQIARAYQFLGRFAPAAAKDALFAKGMDAAKKALAVNPNSVGGHYWYSACLSRWLESKGVTTKLKHLGELKSHLMAARKIDPAFFFGGPARVLGMIAFKSPLASNKEAIQYLHESLKYAPDYSLTLVNLGEVLIKEKQYVEAKQHLQKVLALSPLPGFERELADDQDLAKKLLASIPAS